MNYKILKDIREMEELRRATLLHARHDKDVTLGERIYFEWSCFRLGLIIRKLKREIKKGGVK